MLKCVYCAEELIDHVNRGFRCTRCDTLFTCDNGIYNFVSKESEIHEFFPEDSFDLLFRLESDNFWFLGRNLLIKHMVTNNLSFNSMILEIGCGTGFVSSYLKKIGFSSVDCSDVFRSAIRYCKERDAGHAYYLFDLEHCPFFEHYDAVCVFDIL